jgi:hypothetical protein
MYTTPVVKVLLILVMNEIKMQLSTLFLAGGVHECMYATPVVKVPSILGTTPNSRCQTYVSAYFHLQTVPLTNRAVRLLYACAFLQIRMWMLKPSLGECLKSGATRWVLKIRCHEPSAR